MSKSSGIRLYATFVAAACIVTSLHLQAQDEEEQETRIHKHITVTEKDTAAAANVKTAFFHVTPAHVEGAKERVAVLQAENQKRLEAAGAASPLPAAVVANALTAPYFYPPDLKKGTGITLATSTHHAAYVNFTGTVAANWGNPEGFLRDLNLSTFIHLLDQYVGSTANNRYPVGANAAVTYGLYGNVIYEHELWAIAHALGKADGAGTGRLYHIFLPKGMDTCFDIQGGCYSPDNTATWAFCAYHSSVTFSDIGTVLFSVEPYQDVAGCAVQTPSPNGQLADSTNSTLSHEFFEAVTDPEGGTGYLNRFDLDLAGAEIGDECQVLSGATGTLVPTFAINGKKYEVQLEYSNKYHACAAVP
jgi:hypothetical protein